MAEESTVVYLKTQLSRHEHFDCSLTMTGHYNAISETIIQCLNNAELNEMISRTQFGNLIVSAVDFNLSGQLLWYLMARQTREVERDEFWMVVKKRPMRFSELEYCLITGLHCSKTSPVVPVNSDFRSRHFHGKSIIRLSDLEKRLKVMADDESVEDVNVEKLKLASLLFVVGVLGPRRSKKDVIVNSWMIRLVEDFDSFNKYPWGTIAYKEVLISLRRKLVFQKEETLRKKDKGGRKYDSCLISGFVHPLQILAYECISGIANAFARRKEAGNSTVPRMCLWETKNGNKNGTLRFKYNDIVKAVNGSKEIIGLLIPTSEEMQTEYYMVSAFEDHGSDDNMGRITSLLCQGRKVICSQIPVDAMDIDYTIQQPSTSASPPRHLHFTPPVMNGEVPPQSSPHQQYGFHQPSPPPQMNDDSSRSSAMLNELLTFMNEKFNCLDEKLNQLKVVIQGHRYDERFSAFDEKMSAFFEERFDAFDERFDRVDEQLDRLVVDVRGGFSEIHKRLANRQSTRASERPMEFTGHVEILSDDSSSETENDQQKNRPSVDLPPEVRLFRSAQSYQEHMKMIPIPRERGTVIPFNSWVGLGNSIKQIYGQPLHYLTNIHLKKLDETRLGAEDVDVPLDMFIHPCKAEASIWIVEETHRKTASPHFLAKLWSSDPMYDVYVDASFVKL